MTRPVASSPSRLLALARSLLLGWIILLVAIQVLLIPSRYERIHSLGPSSVSSTAFNGWTTEQIQQSAQNQGLNPEIIAGIMFLASLICLLIYWVVGGILFWRKSSTWTGLLAAFILFGIGTEFSNLRMIDSQNPTWLNTTFQLIAVLIWTTFIVMLYVFPNGKFVPPFIRYLAIVPYVLVILSNFSRQVDAATRVIIVIYASGGLASQVYRYLKVSTPDERQQTKWIVVAMGLFLGLLVLSLLIPVFFPFLGAGTPEGFWWEFVGNGIVGILLPVVLPLAIAASILRYRLWDIDLVIRRTLQYSLVTALIGLIYFGIITILQSLFTSLSGQESAAALVLSTLGIAALFNPLHRRVQDFIDRRFNRRKYDGEKALAEFAAAARSETDLGLLSRRLTSTVQDSLQPTSINLWIRSGFDHTQRTKP